MIIPVLFRSMARNVHMYEAKRFSLTTNATGYHVIKKILISMLVITIIIERIQRRVPSSHQPSLTVNPSEVCCPVCTHHVEANRPMDLCLMILMLLTERKILPMLLHAVSLAVLAIHISDCTTIPSFQFYFLAIYSANLNMKL